jgi:ATP-dependent helicase/nuclease subunit B
MINILCEDWQKEFVFEELRKETGKNVLNDIRVPSLSQYIDSVPERESVQLLRLRRLLLSNQEAFSLYENMFSYPAFYEEILSFAKKCALYGIAAEDLPETGENQKQLKGMVRLALQLDLSEKKTCAEKEQIEENIRNTRDLEILTGFETEIFRFRLLQNLRNLPHRSWASEKKPELHLRHALTETKEMEAVAQQLVKDPRPCNIILTNAAIQMPSLTAVFERYGIPFNAVMEPKKSRIGEVFSVLVRFALDPNAENLLACIHENAFGPACPDDVLQFLQDTLTGTDFPDQPVERCLEAIETSRSDKTNENSGEDLLRLEEKARNWFERIRGSIQNLTHLKEDFCPTLSEPARKIAAAYEEIRNSRLLKSPFEYAAASSLCQDLEAVLPEIRDAEEARFYRDTLSAKQETDRRIVTDFCTVTDLTHPVPARYDSYVLGCSARNYPAIPSENGLFDESYVEQIAGYPSLKERSEAYQEQLTWIGRSCSEHLYYSYPTSSYDGKASEPAFEITSLFAKGEDQRWELEEGNWQMEQRHEISDPDLFQELFFTEGKAGEPVIHGSVSKVESWFRCPYSFFLKYGLGMRTKTYPDLDALTIGNIQHAALEILVRECKKQYTRALASRIPDLIHPYFEALRQIKPHRKAQIDLTEQRMQDALAGKEIPFGDYEKASIEFVPQAEEFRFDHFKIHPQIELQGTIDRIDLEFYYDLFRIIDYKSSDRDIHDADVQTGQKLQLLSYLIVAAEDAGIQEDLSKAAPAGLLYYPLSVMRNEAGKVKTMDFRNEETKKEAMLKASQFHGWSFLENSEPLDDTGTHIQRIRKGYHDYEAAKNMLYEVYDAFVHKLCTKEGILVHPVRTGQNLPCAFCDYRPVCRYHGDGYEPEKVTERISMIPIKKKKGDQ